MNTSNSVAQYTNQIWPLCGSSATGDTVYNIKFTQFNQIITPVIRKIRFNGGITSVSDSLNVIFFTNGCAAGNIANDTIQNGDSLEAGPCAITTCQSHGSPMVQSNIVLPKANDSTYLYLLQANCDYPSFNPSKLLITGVDMTGDSGRGMLVDKNSLVYSGNLCGGFLTAVKHSNGNDWWVIQHLMNSATYLMFLVSDTGIAGPFSQTIGSILSDAGQGNSKFSPDGRWFATTAADGHLELLNFNRCTGELSNPMFINESYFQCISFYRFVEFSPNSRFLYYVCSDGVYQLDLHSTDILNSAMLVGPYDNYVDSFNQETYFFYPQLASNGKIYISSNPAQKYLSIIENPDSLGFNCTVNQHNFYVPCLISFLPNLVNYDLDSMSTATCDSLMSIDFIDKSELSIYPNPSEGKFFLETSNKFEILSVEIHNISGSLLYKGRVDLQNNMIEIDKCGVYFLRITLKNGRILFRKLIVV